MFRMVESIPYDNIMGDTGVYTSVPNHEMGQIELKCKLQVLCPALAQDLGVHKVESEGEDVKPLSSQPNHLRTEPCGKTTPQRTKGIHRLHFLKSPSI